MFKFIANWLLHALALYLVAAIIPGIHLSGFGTAIVAIAVISLINVLIKPVLIILTLPINILTLGLFTFVINALLFIFASHLTPGFTVNGFGIALLGSILYSAISTLFRRAIE
jgi:putative membrane protein